MRRLRAISFLAVLVASTYLRAQMRGAPVVHTGAASLGPRSFVASSHSTVLGHPGFARRFPRSTLFLPFFYSDLGDFDQPPPPQVIVVRQPIPVPEPVRSEAPILIEWQGDRYVRISGDDRQAVSPSPGSPPPPPPRETPSATLVFRDGTRQEVSSYTIVDGVLYAHSDYWTSGTWTQPIPLAQLDIARTIACNQQKGVRFPLPSGAHEVVVRP